jgi:hypothetical protein
MLKRRGLLLQANRIWLPLWLGLQDLWNLIWMGLGRLLPFSIRKFQVRSMALWRSAKCGQQHPRLKGIERCLVPFATGPWHTRSALANRRRIPEP